VARGLEKRPTLLGLERALAQLEGTRGQQLGLIARTEQAIGEAKLQIASLRNTQAKEVAAELRDAQTKLGELEDRLRAAADIQGRTQIAAPQSGRVVNLRHYTPGGVVKPGEPLLDVVPQDDKLVIEARVSPLDIDTVHAGLDAEVKLTAFKQRRLPVLVGQVTSVSADALVDERTGQSFYTAQIELAADELARLNDIHLYPGMPAEVLVLTGARTPLEYFLDPLRDSFRRAFRED
jgi:HlyD family type I secretion membrane fusion protein